MSAHRLLREIADFKKNPTEGIEIESLEDNNRKLTGYIYGPPDTCYQTGIFEVEIIIPDSYPFFPPKLKFNTKIWHPNVSSQTGYICLDILDKNWAAAMTLRVVLISLRAMLADPNPSDPQDAVVANQMRNDIQLYNNTAQYWTYYYARGKEYDENLKQIHNSMIEMGFDGDSSLHVLSIDWDADKTIDRLVKR